jgi:hypothetical protein
MHGSASAVAIDVAEHGRRPRRTEDDPPLGATTVVRQVAEELAGPANARIGPTVAVEIAEQRQVALLPPVSERDRYPKE